MKQDKSAYVYEISGTVYKEKFYYIGHTKHSKLSNRLAEHIANPTNTLMSLFLKYSDDIEIKEIDKLSTNSSQETIFRKEQNHIKNYKDNYPNRVLNKHRPYTSLKNNKPSYYGTKKTRKCLYEELSNLGVATLPATESLTKYKITEEIRSIINSELNTLFNSLIDELDLQPKDDIYKLILKCFKESKDRVP